MKMFCVFILLLLFVPLGCVKSNKPVITEPKNIIAKVAEIYGEHNPQINKFRKSDQYASHLSFSMIPNGYVWCIRAYDKSINDFIWEDDEVRVH